MKNTLLKYATSCRVIAMVFALFMFSQGASSQCDFTLACNDGIQVSLDNQCEEVITPDMLLENPDFPDSEYEVNLYLADGTLIPNAMITSSHIGLQIEASITLLFNNCNLTCWGYIIVEDKLPPLLSCPADMTIDCGEPTSTGFLGMATATDCSGVTGITNADSTEVLMCTGDYESIIRRTFSATDFYGNVSTCVQTIHVMKGLIENVVFPEDFVQACESIVGGPSMDPEVTGFPSLIGCSNIQYYFQDYDFPLCGAGLKKLREWHVLDWCTGEDTTYRQTIKIEDTEGPIIACGNTYYFIDSDINSCSVDYNVPLPVHGAGGTIDNPRIIYDCSEVTYTISYAILPDGIPCESVEDVQALGEANLQLDYIEVPPNANGEVIIENLPVGCSWIRYDFWDACGHHDFCTKDVFVVDATPPIAICEGFTVVSIDESGWSSVFATSIDDHSWDDCGQELIYEVRRPDSQCDELPAHNPSDLTFDDQVHFCCEDAGEYVTVELRVTDTEGNFNICQAFVLVEDKIDPIIYCPDETTIGCDEDYEDFLEDPTAIDNCGINVSDPVITEFIDECGIGYVLAVYNVEDNNGNGGICTQRINITNNDPLTEAHIIWPPDLDTDKCDDDDLDPEVLNSLPLFTNNSGCSNIGISHDDLKFYNTEDVCVKVLRKWTIADWCSTPVNYYSHTQKILVSDNDPPEFIGCTPSQSFPPTGDCEGEVSLTIEVTDECSPDNQLRVTWEVDLFIDASINDSGTGKTISDVYPTGTHRAIFTAEDNCDNISQCFMSFTITDDQAPTPVCLTEVIWVLNENGIANVWANDFNFKSYDACDEDEDLSYSFNEAGNQTNMFFNCDDLENGIAQSIPLQMWVHDTDGNRDFCEVTLLLQDNGLNVCEDSPDNMARVEGMVTNESLIGLQDMEVELYNTDTEYNMMEMTTEEGSYAFNEVSYYNEYSLHPTKNNDANNGVSTLDLVLIQKHVLGLQAIESPYKLIAADINNSDNITGIDLVELRKLILGIYTEFPNNESWKFIPTQYEFADAAIPWGYPTTIEIDDVYVDEMGADFIGVKIGDVNGSVSNIVQSNDIAVRSVETVTVNLDNVALTAGENVSIDMHIDMNNKIEGFQLALDVDLAMVSLQDIKASVPYFSEANWTVNDRGLLMISWNNITEDIQNIKITLEVEVLQSLYLDEAVQMNDVVPAEIYNGALETSSLDLNYRDQKYTQENKAALLQNTPNPFYATTDIKFYIPDDGRVMITIVDLNGRTVYTSEKRYTAGMHTLSVDKNQLNSTSGVYYYNMVTDNKKLTKKMILIK